MPVQRLVFLNVSGVLGSSGSDQIVVIRFWMDELRTIECVDVIAETSLANDWIGADVCDRKANRPKEIAQA